MLKQHEERIKLNDGLVEIMTKMSDGNPGALTALMELYTKNAKVDPDSALGPFSSILGLDSNGIYGTDIYILWNDICERDIVKMIAVLRATQLGLFNNQVLKAACADQMRNGKAMVPVDELYEKVKERLPDFNAE